MDELAGDRHPQGRNLGRLGELAGRLLQQGRDAPEPLAHPGGPLRPVREGPKRKEVKPIEGDLGREAGIPLRRPGGFLHGALHIKLAL